MSSLLVVILAGRKGVICMDPSASNIYHCRLCDLLGFVNVFKLCALLIVTKKKPTDWSWIVLKDELH